MTQSIPNKSSSKKLWGALAIIIILVSALSSIAFFSAANQNSTGSNDCLGVSISPEGSSFQLGVNQSKTFAAQALNGSAPYNFTWTIVPTGNFNLSVNGQVVSLENATNLEVTGENLTVCFPYAVENDFVQVYVSAIDSQGLEGKSDSILVADPYTSPGYKFDASTATASYIFQTDSKGWYRAIEGSTGAVIKSSTDAGVVLNTVIDNGNVAISFSVGTYLFYTPITSITGQSGVKLIGESRGAFDNFSDGVVLKYVGAATTAFIDARGCRDFSIEDLKIIGNGAATIGVYMGDSTNSASKTKGINLDNIVVDGFGYGLKGYTWGPDDSNLRDSFVGNNSVANIDNLSSMFRVYGGSLYTSPIGVRVQRAAGTSADAGMQFFGTVWSGCSVAIDVIGNQSINALTFSGCWIEACSTMILRTTGAQAGITIGTVTFDNTVATVASEVFMDLSGRNIQLEWRNGELYPTNGVGAAIITDGVGGSIQRLSVYPYAGADLLTYTDSNNGLKGIHSAVQYLYQDANGYNPAGATGASWVSAWQDQKCAINSLSIVKATVHYRWNPGSTGGGIALYYGGERFGVVEPGVNGGRVDSVDITNAIRNVWGVGGDLGMQLHGDDSTAPTVWYIEIIYEW